MMNNYQGRNQKAQQQQMQPRRKGSAPVEPSKGELFSVLERELNAQRERLLETVPGLIKAANKGEDWVKEQINHALFVYIGKGADGLRKCTIGSILKSVKDACDLGVSLAPHRKEAVLMPYKDQCSLHVQYQGYVKLMLQDPNVLEVYADVAHEGDEFSVSSGTDRAIHHNYCTRTKDRGEPTWAYSVVVLKSGVKKFEAAPWSEILKMRASAQSKKVWDRWPVQMAKGKMIRRLTNYVSLDAPSMDRLLRVATMEDKVERGIFDEPEILEAPQKKIDDVETPVDVMAELRKEAKEKLRAEPGDNSGEVIPNVPKTGTRKGGGIREEAR